MMNVIVEEAVEKVIPPNTFGNTSGNALGTS